jgi:hypothetical protein
MSSQKVEITSPAIRKMLKKYTPERAISEYVSNGFDARATVIHINYVVDELDMIKEISISDDGTGICYEELRQKFKKFFESNKNIRNENESDIVRGKNGYGRFTFFKFARFAKWETSYNKNDDIRYYEIKISSEDLINYTSTDPIDEGTSTGTKVVFTEVDSKISGTFIEEVLKPYLKAEFAWFLELKEEYKIYINEEELDYTTVIADEESFPVTVKCDTDKVITFNCKYIRWNTKMNDEYSQFYFLNNKLDLKSTKTTLLNKKGDNFWHSVVITDDFFNDINCDNDEDIDDAQTRLFDDVQDRKIFKSLVTELNNYLKNKRRPFLKKQASLLVNKYEEEEVFPKFGDNEWDIARKQNLQELVKNMYEVEPAVFMKLNKEQKKIFLELLNLIMDSDERENLFKIIGCIVDLNSDDRKEFAKILETTRLRQVISTIKLISDRLLTLENLKKIVFNHELKANERDNLQKFIERNYWIFGEEYRLVCAEEVKFEAALRKYIYILCGVNENEYIDHPDKYKEMDLFLAGVDYKDDRPHNLIIEIKSPSTIKKLTSKELTQIKTYIDVILQTDSFNDHHEYWTFYLIGQDYDNIIKEDIIKSDSGLLRERDNYSLYVKKWSEIINDVERRLRYLDEKLRIERTKLSNANSLKEIMEESMNNSAVTKN